MTTAFIVAAALIAISLISACLAIYLDLRTYRNERAIGKFSTWYKRPAIVGNIGTILMMLSMLAIVAVFVHILALSIPLFFFLIVLMIFSACLSTGRFMLMMTQKRKASAKPKDSIFVGKTSIDDPML
jgi:uncharacterized membrane protein YidH (DUF202 family)